MTKTEPGRRRVFRPEVAQRAGISEASVRRYLETARARRRNAADKDAAGAGMPWPPDDASNAELPQPGDMPEPDGYDYPPDRKLSGERAQGARAADPAAPRHSGSKSPWWHEDTIGPWLAGRRAPGKNRADGSAPRRRAAPSARAAARKINTPRTTRLKDST